MRLSLLLLCCFAIKGFAQLQVSKTFPTPPRSTPLQVLNCGEKHFYMLRYNRLAHDITIERRRKDDAGIAAFTPLKLDSVNASWFNYEDLDYLFFEKQGRVFFVFERVLNSRSQVYMKEIDTLGRTSGFIEVASLAAEKNEDRLSLTFGLTRDKDLLITRQRIFGFDVYKQVTVIDPLSRKERGAWKLPVENPETGYSHDYSFDESWNLYYALLKFRTDYFQDVDYATLLQSRPNVDSMSLVSFDRKGQLRRRRALPFKGPVRMHSLESVADTTRLALHMMYSATDTEGEERIYLAIWRFDGDLNESGFRQQTLQEDLAGRLTYFDGSEYDSPARKLFTGLDNYTKGNITYHQAERRNESFYKEILIWRTDDDRDRIEVQQLVPRKIFFFQDRSPFRTIGMVMQCLHGTSLSTFVLEHPGNGRIDAAAYLYRDFARQETPFGANLAAYTIGSDGALSKKIVFEGDDFSCIPLKYVGNSQDMILYLVKGDLERFAILPLSQL
jgi:hypothetical protein